MIKRLNATETFEATTHELHKRTEALHGGISELIWSIKAMMQVSGFMEATNIVYDAIEQIEANPPEHDKVDVYTLKLIHAVLSTACQEHMNNLVLTDMIVTGEEGTEGASPN